MTNRGAFLMRSIFGGGIFAIAICALALAPNFARAAELIWTGDFETGDFSQYKSKLSGEGSRSKRKIVTSPVRNGKYASELTILGVGVDDGNRGIERAELVTRKDGGGKIHFKWDGPEYWMGFSFLFTEWEASAFTFFQVHAPNEAKGHACDMAGNAFSVWGDGADENDGISREIAVRVIENGGESTGKGAGSNNKIVHSYPFPINEWQDYVVNFKLSTRGDGFYKVWKNGQVIYAKSGLTNVNYRDSCGKPIPKNNRNHNGVHVGIYSPGNPAFRRIYYDEVRVAEGPDGYDLVAPVQDENSELLGIPEEGRSTPKPPVISVQ